MKRILLFVVVSMLAVSTSFAADFAPTTMSITGSTVVQYDFDGAMLDIPVTVTGAPAGVILSVFTKDQANNISAVQNGFLGWHYVNKIDTCIYMGDLLQLDIGKGSMKWDGKDNDGGVVPAGEYTYYIYGYDNINQKKKAVSEKIYMDRNNRVQQVTHNADGSPKTNPEFYMSDYTKLVIGSDPEDSTLIETTMVPESFLGHSHHVELDPADHNNFFTWAPIRETVVERIAKLQWVPNGEAVLMTEWGDDEGFASFTIPGMVKIANFTMADIAIAGDYIIMAAHDNSATDPTNLLAYVTIEDGVFEKEIDVSDRWFSLDDQEAGGQGSGGPSQIVDRDDNFILSRFNACYREMVNPLVEDEEELVLWGNDNGDYVGDHNFEEDSAKPWVCNDYNVGPYAYNTDADANLFSSFGCYDMGASSFGLIAPDGTGIGYFAFAGETANFKYGTYYLDYGSSFDGIYTDNRSTSEEDANTGIWFIAHDSFKGVITNAVNVDEDPAGFAVSQNSPNPFNPSTTISFTTPEAGNVSIEVFNVAGQKVGTLANEMMSAGNHSINWDASGYSAGIYFYMVKSGDFSKTMKMTLLK